MWSNSTCQSVRRRIEGQSAATVRCNEDLLPPGGVRNSQRLRSGRFRSRIFESGRGEMLSAVRPPQCTLLAAVWRARPVVGPDAGAFASLPFRTPGDRKQTQRIISNNFHPRGLLGDCVTYFFYFDI